MSDRPLILWASRDDDQPKRKRKTGRARVEECMIVGCTRVRRGQGLCHLHERRKADGKPLIADHEDVGVRRSGYGIYGVIIATDDAILCYECGRWFRMITHGHLQRAHGMNQDEYRQRHGLPWRAGLCCGEYAEAGRARNARLERERGFYAEATERLRAAPRPQGTARASAAGRAAWAKTAAEWRREGRKCRECGGPMPTDPSWRFAKYCSTECVGQVRRRARHLTDARRHGESLDFQRREGTGRQLTREAVAAAVGLSAVTVHARVRQGTFPIHDGRRGGEPWWWESSLVGVEGDRRRRKKKS